MDSFGRPTVWFDTTYNGAVSVLPKPRGNKFSPGRITGFLVGKFVAQVVSYLFFLVRLIVLAKHVTIEVSWTARYIRRMGLGTGGTKTGGFNKYV